MYNIKKKRFKKTKQKKTMFRSKAILSALSLTYIFVLQYQWLEILFFALWDFLAAIPQVTTGRNSASVVIQFLNDSILDLHSCGAATLKAERHKVEHFLSQTTRRRTCVALFNSRKRKRAESSMTYYKISTGIMAACRCFPVATQSTATKKNLISQK